MFFTLFLSFHISCPFSFLLIYVLPSPQSIIFANQSTVLAINTNNSNLIVLDCLILYCVLYIFMLFPYFFAVSPIILDTDL